MIRESAKGCSLRAESCRNADSKFDRLLNFKNCLRSKNEDTLDFIKLLCYHSVL